LEKQIKDAGATILYGTSAKRLITNDKFEVVGAIVKDTKGKISKVGAKATILCTGGFQANHELVSRYFGPRAENWVTSGTPYNKGEGYLVGVEVGADTFNHVAFYATLEVEAARTNPDMIMSFTFPYASAQNGIVVNEFGDRFCDESGTRHIIAHYMVKQPLQNIRGLMIFDKNIYENFGPKATLDEMVKQGMPVVQANTVEELAQKTGFSMHLVDTVAEYNKAVTAKATDRLAVPKTANINPISTPPYYGIVILPGTPYCQGGLKTNTKAQVLDLDGNPIPGLLAAGDMMTGNSMGIVENKYGGYVGGLMNALMFGLISAETAAAAGKV
jgi:tricarballylate dehydrogenase